MSDLVGNPEDRFSRVAAHISLGQSEVDCSSGKLFGLNSFKPGVPFVGHRQTV